MADLIERDALLKYVCGACLNPEAQCIQTECYLYREKKRIEAAPAVNRWISVIVIPDYEHGETVAECIARTQKEIVNVRLGFLGFDGWYMIDDYPMIIAPKNWMPANKPEPPEKE